MSIYSRNTNVKPDTNINRRELCLSFLTLYAGGINSALAQSGENNEGMRIEQFMEWINSTIQLSISPNFRGSIDTQLIDTVIGLLQGRDAYSEDEDIVECLKGLKNMTSDDHSPLTELNQKLLERGYYFNMYPRRYGGDIFQKVGARNVFPLDPNNDLVGFFQIQNDLPLDFMIHQVNDSSFLPMGISDSGGNILINSSSIRKGHEDYVRFVSQIENPIFREGVMDAGSFAGLVILNEGVHKILKEQFGFEALEDGFSPDSWSIHEFLSDIGMVVGASNKLQALIYYLFKTFSVQIQEYSFSHQMAIESLKEVGKDIFSGDIHEKLDLYGTDEYSPHTHGRVIYDILNSMSLGDVQKLFNILYQKGVLYIDTARERVR